MLRLAADLILWGEDNLESKFNHSQIWVRGSERVKSQKFNPIESIDRQPNISKNQSPRSIKRGDMGVFLFFDI